ncbi:MAG: hypothetical protein WC254_02210 [Candidatus Woesearchaeota archaeon]|jgi:hypothetical protein
MNKKAMMEFLVGLIILLAVAVIILIFYAKTSAVSEAKSVADGCRQTIELNGIGRIGGTPLFEDINCPTEYKMIDTDNSDEIKKALAQDMAMCWYKMGEGQYELFDTDMMQEKQYCIICSVSEFDNKQEISGFLDYMTKNPAPLLYTGGKTISYTDYLQGYTSDSSRKLLYEQETQDTIKTEYDYATIFLYGKKGYVSKVWGGAGGTAAGLTVGLVGGFLIIGGWTAPAGIAILAAAAGGAGGYALGSEKNADWESGILLSPYTTEELNKLNCEILPAKQ